MSLPVFLMLLLGFAPNFVLPWLRSWTALLRGAIARALAVWIFAEVAVATCDDWGCLGAVLLTGLAAVSLVVAFVTGALLLTLCRGEATAWTRSIACIMSSLVALLAVEACSGGRLLSKIL